MKVYKMKLIAFYLPQFHIIPENNNWWGEGFTEWTNVKRATPLFPGHNQPRIPLNKYYYDLSNVDVMRWQVDIAKEHGIYGFCFYHYWFSGKLLLEKPLENLLSNPDIDINYCISWANENWTNGWVSDDNQLLIGHDFDDEKDWQHHFQYFLKFFEDPRYIKEDGKPLLVIYVPHHIKKLRKMLEFWTNSARMHGFPGIKYIYQHPHSHFSKTMDHSLFDYGIEFQPQFDTFATQSDFRRNILTKIPQISGWLQKNLNIYLKRPRTKKQLKKFDYDKAWRRIIDRKPDRDNMIATAFVDWDNTPRKGTRGSVYSGANPEKFQNYFDQLLLKVRNEYQSQTVFIFAWNEWAEGGYLEPDEHHGFGYLKAIKNSLDKIKNSDLQKR